MTTTADIDRGWPFCRPSWLLDVGQNPYSNLNDVMKAIHIWNLEEIRLKMTELEWPRQQILKGGGHLSAIMVIECRTKLVFELDGEVGGSNPYMKFGRNSIKIDWVRVATDRRTDKPKTKELHQNPYPTTIFVLKILSTLYACCIYLNALKTKFYHGSKHCIHWSDCSLLYYLINYSVIFRFHSSSPVQIGQTFGWR